MISSRKEQNVERALKILKKEYGDKKIQGVVCHVSNKDHRNNLIQEASSFFLHLFKNHILYIIFCAEIKLIKFYNDLYFFVSENFLLKA